jgi:hypothetical protein
VVEPVGCDLVWIKYRHWQSHYLSQVFPEVKIGKSINVRSNTLKFLNGAWKRMYLISESW